MHVLIDVFFFFQAEDGIRDYKVTGVQTCALPIWDHGACGLTGAIGIEWSQDHHRKLKTASVRFSEFVGGDLGSGVGGLRSEERRVGKECRSRWSPYH